MHVEPHHTIEALEAAAKREKRARVAHRIRAVILARRGYTAPEIERLLGSARRAVQQWVQWYNQEGLEGLPDAPRPGQPKRLSPEQERQLSAWLDAGPRPDGPTCAYRGPQVHDRIGSYFGVPMTLSGSYKLLHRLGYSALRPRPRHRKADPVAQEEFKKSAPLLSSSSAVQPRDGSPRSGSRTKPASASRGR